MASTSTYAAAHEAFHKIFARVVKLYGFEDMMLVDADSLDVVYAYQKTTELGTSLEDGPYAGSQMATKARGLRGQRDRLHLLDAALLGRLVDRGHEVAEQGQRPGLADAVAEGLHPEHLGEEHRHVGELPARPLVAVAALGRGRGGQDGQEQLLVLADLRLELLPLLLDARRHLVEHLAELAEFVPARDRHPHVAVARPEPLGMAYTGTPIAAIASQAADTERPLEEEHQPRHEVAQGLLQGQTDHDRAHPQRRQRPLDLLPPDLRVDDEPADGHEDRAHEVAEQRRHPLPPGAGAGEAEEQVVEEAENGVEDHHPEQRLRDAARRAVHRHLEDRRDEHHQRQRRGDERAEGPQRADHREAATVAQRDRLVEEQQHRRKAHRQQHGGPEVRDLAGDLEVERPLHGVHAPTVQASMAGRPSSSTLAGPLKATASPVRSRTGAVTRIAASRPPARRLAIVTVSPHRS